MPRLGVWCAATGIALGTVSLPAIAWAQGFGVFEHGACAMGRAGATVADPCRDGSSIFFNPAGITQLENNTVNAGVTLLAARGNFTHETTLERDELVRSVIPVPTFYLGIPLDSRLTLGLGVFVPYGLETEWDETAQGRFLGHNSKITATYVQPTIGYKVNDWLSVGGGVDFNFVSVELKQRLDLSEQIVPGTQSSFGAFGIPNRTDFADAHLDGNGITVGYNIGIIAKATDWISFGVRYLSRQKANLDGVEVRITRVGTGLFIPTDFTLPNGQTLLAGTPVDAIVAPLFLDGGPLSDQGANTVLRFPEQLVLGTVVQVSPQVKVLVDYQYTNWNVFESLPLKFERIGPVTLQQNFVETHGLRLGGEYAFNSDTQLRLGFLTHGAAAPPETVTPNLPEGARSDLTVGFGTRLTKSLRFDFAYQYVAQVDRRGRSTDGGSQTPTVDVNDGLYQFEAHLFGLSLIYKF